VNDGGAPTGIDDELRRLLGDELPRPVEWRDGRVRFLDQRALPAAERYIEGRSLDDLCDAIAHLAVRGAPALGAAGAYGAAWICATTTDKVEAEAAAARLASTRPTAVNLAWAVDQVVQADAAGGADAALARAHAIALDDVRANLAIGDHGSALLSELCGARRVRVLTHCNAGHLATVGFGTALGVVRTHFAAGLIDNVWVDETRPLLQGARLTAWELGRLGVPHAVIVDSAAASLMRSGQVDVVVVGADRIAANGDVANKIGTYGLAVLARHHGVPFVVAAPTSTLDPATPSGTDIPIEVRDPAEILAAAPSTSEAWNPAFDVTPAALVSAVVTELGITRTP
jgi:methylthioribose-1-phosphate isomerase